MVVEDDCPVPVEVMATPGTQRNLSAWSIAIPYVDFYDDEVKKERVPVFCIDVERHDREHGVGQIIPSHMSSSGVALLYRQEISLYI